MSKDIEFQGLVELTNEKQADMVPLRPVRPDWLSFADKDRTSADFLNERPDLIEEGRLALDSEARTTDWER